MLMVTDERAAIPDQPIVGIMYSARVAHARARSTKNWIFSSSRSFGGDVVTPVEHAGISRQDRCDQMKIFLLFFSAVFSRSRVSARRAGVVRPERERIQKKEFST